MIPSRLHPLGSVRRSQKVFDGINRFERFAHMRTMPRSREQVKSASMYMFSHIPAYVDGPDYVFGALQHQCWNAHVRKITTVVREECNLGKLLCNHRVRGAESLFQFLC